MEYKNVQEAVCEIKALIENSIRTGGVEGKNNLIRSQTPICLLHDAVKAAFIELGVNPALVNPPYAEHIGELRLAGFFKCKDQDICILPNDVQVTEEVLDFDGILKGTCDPYGFELTQRTLSVNVRSQLSSTAKNFDTLYERTFAEALNLHLRCPKMVLGELYMIPVFEYDDVLAKEHKVGFKKNRNIQRHIEKYLHSFGAVNKRGTVRGKEYKYERVCLLVVDFSQPVPKVYHTDTQLRADGLLSKESTASIRDLGFPAFAQSLLKTYEARFGTGKFK